MACSSGRQSFSVGTSRRSDRYHGFGAAERCGGWRSRSGHLPRFNCDNQRCDIMVVRSPKAFARQSASLMTELLVAMAILVGVLIPLAWSLTSERRLARGLYERAVAMQIVDSELEVL